MINRRTFTLSVLGSAIAPAALYAQSFEVTRTDAQWRAMLTDLQYQVMRHEATERSGTSPLDGTYAAGTYTCRGCDLALYTSETKFDSRTGWPSFYVSLTNAIGTKEDNTFFQSVQSAIAAAAEATLATSLTTVRRRLENGIA